MTRKWIGMMLAVAVAGGVYFTAQPAGASNMGFKLEREFRPVQGFNNFFYVSFPLFNGLDPDRANTAAAEGNKCVGDPMGPAAGDGILNADDAICDLWTSRTGTFIFSRYNIDTCELEVRVAQGGALGVFFSNTFTQALPIDEAFQIQAPHPGSDVANDAVIVGSHDPMYTGRPLNPNAACRPDLQLQLINLPYHTMYQNALEVLCGHEGSEWEYRADGKPGPVGDPESAVICPGGIWDGAHFIRVSWFDNVQDAGGPIPGVNTDNQTLTCEVRPGLGSPEFPGLANCFDLIPGEGYIVQMDVAHNTTTFLSPFF